MTAQYGTLRNKYNKHKNVLQLEYGDKLFFDIKETEHILIGNILNFP